MNRQYVASELLRIAQILTAKKELKVVWMACDSQKFGNLQWVRPPTVQEFKKEILPRTKKGYYGNGSVEEQYKEMMKKHPDIAIKWIQIEHMGKNWVFGAVTDFENFVDEVKRKPQWAKIVKDFNSKEATEWRKLNDRTVYGDKHDKFV